MCRGDDLRELVGGLVRRLRQEAVLTRERDRVRDVPEQERDQVMQQMLTIIKSPDSPESKQLQDELKTPAEARDWARRRISRE